MTKSIEELAREAAHPSIQDALLQYIVELTRFAALVRAQYREELLAGSGEPVAYEYRTGKQTALSKDYVAGVRATHLYTADQMTAAVLRERERCATVCDTVYYQNIGPEFGEVRHGIASCAAAIRGQK